VTDKKAALLATFERALEEISTRVRFCADSFCASHASKEHGNSASSPDAAITDAALLRRIAIAYSGGLDSSVLLKLAHDYCAAKGIELFAFHIHHGISANADSWLQHCETNAVHLGAIFDAKNIKLVDKEKKGVEEAARISRYAALGELCQKHQVSLILTAHHQDDQAETVLLQLLRGSGVAGLSGMELANVAPDLLGSSTLVMGRPLLTVSRAGLESYAEEHGISNIEDESNFDVRYARNAVRHQVAPILEQFFPGFQERLARVATHAQAAQRLLTEVAASDLAHCLEDDSLVVDKLESFSVDRIDNLLRYWLSMHEVRMPSTAWLNEMRTQLLQAKEDSQLCVTHPDCNIRRYRNRVFLTPRREQETEIAPLEFFWHGEEKMHFPAYGGSLHFERAEQGINANWLRNQSLTIRYRQGGERLKLAPNRPSKSLKHHYQTLNVPAWERKHLPLICLGNEVLFAAGIGMDCRHVDLFSNDGIRFCWKPAA
jgi:tRNA(Ile)-lysidine synthase